MTGSTAKRHGIILFAHGSRDPLWRAPMEAVAARVAARDPSVLVACAYLEITAPDLSSAARTLIEQGAGAITVVPLFLGVGKHARSDLPALMDELRQAHPGMTWTLQPAVGENPALLDLLASIALSSFT